ncbi:unnamed protein product [Hymenolepis diminuta]|uniref:Uncharacterized protein n=1 Tax=Hymenolepis diminuta TaxID=6216 RepID=A0A564Y2G1_HYMDI|nr:unnamed protein product [Hymenolepis diminuta]
MNKITFGISWTTRISLIKKIEIDRLIITRCCSLRHSRRIPIIIIINRGADFVAVFTSISIVLSLNISVRTVIRTDTTNDSIRVVNDGRAQATT